MLTLGATTPFFSDDLSSPDSGWGVFEGASGTIAYADGALVATVTADANSLWSWRKLGGTYPVERVEGTVVIRTDGAAGYQCGSAAPDFLMGLVTGREWLVGTLLGGVISVTSRGPLPADTDPTRPAGAHVAIECALTPSGDRVALWVDGTQVADISGGQVGPFDRAAVFADTSVAPGSATFDDIAVHVGASIASMSLADATQAFLLRVPEAFRATCHASHVTPGTGQTLGVQCSPNLDATAAGYDQYESTEALTGGFEASLADNGATATATGDSCAQGPSRLRYTIGGEAAGELACFPTPGSPAGITLAWTDEALNILAFGQREDDDYAALYDWWLTAGPDR